MLRTLGAWNKGTTWDLWLMMVPGNSATGAKSVDLASSDLVSTGMVTK